MSPTDRESMFGKAESGYLWCLHCERAYKEDEYRTEVNEEGHLMEMCYYEDCDGDAVMDAWEWEKIRDANGYPEIPEEGKVYPQYGE